MSDLTTSKSTDRQEPPVESTERVRLSVVLSAGLAEYIRVRAFEERLSRSAYLRHLVERDALNHGGMSDEPPIRASL